MSNTAQRVDMERLRELLAKATPGPWACHDGPSVYQHRISSHRLSPAVCDVFLSGDAALIAEGISALPALLLQVAAQAAEIERLKFVVLERNRRAEAAERAREEACGLLREVIDEFAGVGCYPCTGSMAPFEDMAGRIAAFLAANGGDKP